MATSIYDDLTIHSFLFSNCGKRKATIVSLTSALGRYLSPLSHHRNGNSASARRVVDFLTRLFGQKFQNGRPQKFILWKESGCNWENSARVHISLPSRTGNFNVMCSFRMIHRKPRPFSPARPDMFHPQLPPLARKQKAASGSHEIRLWSVEIHSARQCAGIKPNFITPRLLNFVG